MLSELQNFLFWTEMKLNDKRLLKISVINLRLPVMMSLTISSNNIHPDINSDLHDESGVVGKWYRQTTG